MTPFPVNIFPNIATPEVPNHVIVGNGASTFLAKGTTTFISRPANFPNKAGRNSPD